MGNKKILGSFLCLLVSLSSSLSAASLDVEKSKGIFDDLDSKTLIISGAAGGGALALGIVGGSLWMKWRKDGQFETAKNDSKKTKENLDKKVEEIKGLKELSLNLEKREKELTTELEKAKEGKEDVGVVQEELAIVRAQLEQVEKAARANGIEAIKARFSANQMEVLQSLLGRILDDYTGGKRKPLPPKGHRRDVERVLVEELQKLFAEQPESPVDLTEDLAGDKPTPSVVIEDDQKDPDYREE